MLKRILPVVFLLASTAASAQYQDSVQRDGYATPAEASTVVAYNPRGSVLPTAMHSYGRVSWIAVNPHLFDGSNLVTSATAPITSVQTCQLYCGGTVTACSSVGLVKGFTVSNHATWHAREAAWNALPQIARNYTAKLALPFGNEIAYVLVTPMMFASGPSVICTQP